MARGWESKSVEAQIDMAEPRSSKRGIAVESHAPDVLDLIRKRESLLLSRVRVVQEISSAQNARYRELLGKALADLDSNLARL
jgi:hypothetical protein